MDFGILPESIWVDILAYLSLCDRYKVSRTCHKLYSVFFCPGVWKNCSVILKMSFQRDASLFSDENYRALRLDQYLKLVDLFGVHIRNLTLEIQGDVNTIESSQIILLESLVNKCKKLKSLHIEIVGMIPKTNIIVGNKCLTFLCAIRSLINSSRSSLHILSIDSWVHSEDMQHNIPLDYLPENLEKLSVFHPVLMAEKWIQLNAIVPTYSEVIAGIQQLKSLKVLSLHCQSISSQLLDELLRTTRSGQPFYQHLSHLEVLITNKQCPFYDIPLTKWKQFSSRVPKILVDVSIGNTVDHKCLSFLSYIDPSSLSIAQYARYFPSLFTMFSTLELKSFVDYSQGCSELSELYNFISSCPKLERLIYNGNIMTSTVLKLAQIKNKKWREFRINLDNIMVDYPLPEGIELTDDKVIVTNSLTGEVVQADLFLRPEMGFYSTDDFESHRRSQLEIMENEVQKCLSCKWRPIRKTKICL